MQNYFCSTNQKRMVIFVTTINKTGLESRLENMEENKVLVTELPLPFDEKDLEEVNYSVTSYQACNCPVVLTAYASDL